MRYYFSACNIFFQDITSKTEHYNFVYYSSFTFLACLLALMHLKDSIFSHLIKFIPSKLFKEISYKCHIFADKKAAKFLTNDTKP